MAKLLLNQEEREAVRLGTALGVQISLKLATSRLLRDVYRQDGWVSMKKTERTIVRLLNMSLLDRDAPKKWWQLF